MLSKLPQRSLRVVRRNTRALSSLAPLGNNANPGPSQSVFDMILNRSSMPYVGLDVEFPSVPTLTEPKAVDKSIKITTLPTGLRVVSTDSYAPISSVGAFVDSGSRYETHQTSGISHFMEHFAFKSTATRSDFRLVRDMCKIGAKIMCSTSREHTFYGADTLREHMPEALATLGDVIQNSSFEHGELIAARKSYAAGIDARAKQADIQIMESIHAAAYFNNSLGMPLYAAKHQLPHFSTEALKAHVASYYTPGRMVIAGVGVEHGAFVKEVAAVFNSLPKDTSLPVTPAKYTGGEVRQHIAGSEDAFAHVALAFETASWQHKDLVPMGVLQMMMGGGGAFSAGGPGKGMYSRLYENVLNRFGWVESATSFNAIFNDSSLFGIYAMCTPENVGQLTTVMVDQFKNMTGAVGADELSRAKEQLKSAVHMQLESETLKLEDLGRQLLTYGKIMTPAEFCAQIDAVTEQDIRRVARDMLKTPVSVAAYGDLAFLPRYDAIASQFK